MDDQSFLRSFSPCCFGRYVDISVAHEVADYAADVVDTSARFFAFGKLDVKVFCLAGLGVVDSPDAVGVVLCEEVADEEVTEVVARDGGAVVVGHTVDLAAFK